MNSVIVKTLVIKFGTAIPFNDLPAFRGSIIAASKGSNVLFHNHLGDGFRYSYPLIQYKRLNGKAAIVCIGEGTDAIGNNFSIPCNQLDIRGKKSIFEVESIQESNTIVQQESEMFVYSIHKYLPLNQENYRRYMETDSLLERYGIVEHCLVGNILSFAKSMGLFFESNVVARIMSMEKVCPYRYKGVEMMGCDLTFKSNVLLPEYIGLGRGVSVGFGMLEREENNKK